MKRSSLLLLLCACAGPPTAPDPGDRTIAWLEGLARPDGGYAWAGENDPHLTPTFAVVGCYRALGRTPPAPGRLAEFIRGAHPYLGPRAETRKHAAELWSLTGQQMQALAWLGESVEPFRDRVLSWKGVSTYPKTYEKGGNPILKEEATALACRDLLALAPDDAARTLVPYLEARRRPDGGFNTTPAAEGGPGHVVNTYWAVRTLLKLQKSLPHETVGWLKECQLPNGGFTWSPKASVGGVDDVVYTWAAVRALEALKAVPSDPTRCLEYLHSLRNSDGGYGYRPGWRSDPLATWHALDALSAFGRRPEGAGRPVPPPARLPEGLRPWTIQIQAPGQGSPAEAVELARALRIHLWGAKNAKPGWIERAQEIARTRGVPVTFFVADEEYGTFVGLAGFGSYSHVSDPIGPAGADLGPSLAGKETPWPDFREARIGALRRAGGRMVWQICDHEEFSRVLLDDSLEHGGYAMLATFHMKQNFVDFLPWSHRYRGRLPFVSLQDAHGPEPWWWTDDLAAHRTIFLAEAPTWGGWLKALENDRVVSVRRDAVTHHELRMSGGAPGVQDLVRRSGWEEFRRPLVSIVALRPGDPFEEGCPQRGLAFRVRIAGSNNPQGRPLEPLAEIESLRVDGRVVEPRLVERKGAQGLTDLYRVFEMPDPSAGIHRAEVTVRPRDGTGPVSASVEVVVPKTP